MAGPYDEWRNTYGVPGPQDPNRPHGIWATEAPRWEELLRGSDVTAIKANPLVQALGAYLSKPSTGIGEVTRVSPIDGRPVPPEPGMLDKLPPTVQEGIGGLGLLSMFLGPGAKTANLPALAKAKSMTGSGAPREAVWNETGWFQGPDKKWRFEIDDSKAALRRRGDDFETQWRSYADKNDAYPELSQMLRHPELEAAYPNMMSRDVKMMRNAEDAGQYINGEFRISGSLPRNEVKPTLLHEAQHAVQETEGFARSGKYQRLSPDEYRRWAHEVEARAVEKRMDMTPDQRRARAPWLDYDVPETQQIVRMLMEGG